MDRFRFTSQIGTGDGPGTTATPAKEWTRKEVGPRSCQCLAEKELELKFMDFQAQCQKEYELRLTTELEELSRKSAGELEKVMRSSNEALQREIGILRDSKASLERSRDEALAKVRDLNIQNQELVLQ
jgi:hypothetical protein